MAKQKSPQQLGNDFQDEVQAMLVDFVRTASRGALFHRYYDTKSAGNMLPPQPADFHVLHDGVFFLIEVKSSTVHRSLASAGCLRANMSPEQAASMRLNVRAKGKSIVIFKDFQNNAIEFWPGGYVGLVHATPREKLLESRCLRIVQPGNALSSIAKSNLYTLINCRGFEDDSYL